VGSTLSGLVDYAISKGDAALKARLEQANAIVQGAIASLNDTLKNRIDQIDQYTRQQRVETSRQIEQTLSAVNVNITRYLKDVDKITDNRIRDAETSAHSMIASLPIPTEPLIVVKEAGFVMFKDKGPTTLLTVAGSGLFKNNDEPKVHIYRADLSPKTAFPVHVISRSMQYVQIAVPNDRITEDMHYVISLRLRRGGKLLAHPEHTEPSFPLFICHRPPAFSVSLRMEATGNVWERRVVQHPDVPAPFQLNCSPGEPLDKSFDPRPHAGWELDTQYGHEGMEAVVGPNDGRGEHRYSWTGSRFNMHCKGTNGEGGYQRVDHLYVGEKRIVANASCGKPASINNHSLDYGKPNEILVDRKDVVKDCIDPTLHATPEVIVTLQLLQSGKPVGTQHIVDHGSGTMLDDKLSYDLDGQGLLKLHLDLFCPMHHDNL
jgi:hypothetical protein